MSPTTTTEIVGTARPATLAREELLSRRLRGAQSGRRGGIPSVPRSGPLPLSTGQQQMWFLSRLEPDSWEYAAPLALRLRGELDPDRLRLAFDGVVARHEILRTCYGLDGGRP